MSERIPDESQRAVIDDFEHNILLRAGAGTGKTFTVAQKVKRAVETGFCKSEEILALTFTIKAADELKTDIEKYCDGDITVKTIHGFCLSVLREQSFLTGDGYLGSVVKDEVDCEEILRSIVSQRTNARFSVRSLFGVASLLKHARESFGLYTSSEENDYKEVFERLDGSSKLTNAFTYTARGGERVFDGECFEFFRENVGFVMGGYSFVLRQTDALDYDDLIILTHRLFKSGADGWRNRYKLVIVDEMQDTSLLEYETVSALFGCRVLMCGDEYQTIYEWRGSEPNEIARLFKSQYGAVEMRLNNNYRSTQVLQRAAVGYLYNAFGVRSGERSANSEKGEKIEAIECATQTDEARWIYSKLKEIDSKKACIVGRTNYAVAALENELDRLSRMDGEPLRFFTVDRDLRFYRRPLSRDIMSVLSALVNPCDTLAFSRIARRYIRGVDADTLDDIAKKWEIGVNIGSFLNKSAYGGDPFGDLIIAARQSRIAVYDIETTGLDRSTDGIIQLAAVRTDTDGKTVDKFNRLIMPKVRISGGAARVHGYTEERLKELGAEDAETVLNDFAQFVSGCVLVGHNSCNFDDVIVDRQLKEYGLKLNISARYDTLAIAKCFLPKLKSYKLSELCDMFGAVNENAHDAFSDVNATKSVLVSMLREFILPSVAERKDTAARYAPVFSKFFEAYTELKGLLNAKPSELLERIIELFRLKNRYKTELDARTFEDFTAVFAAAEGNAGEFVRKLIDEAALSGNRADGLIKRLDKIPVVTVHQTKGCEYETVFLADADSSSFPSASALRAGGEDEEKRVFYVALTRAKSRFYICNAKYTDFGRKKERSPYIALIPSDTLTAEQTTDVND